MITYDLETWPITVADPWPRPVCSSAKLPGEEAWIHAGFDAVCEHGVAMLEGDHVISTHSAFDLWVLARATGRVDLVLERYAAGLVVDTQVRELLVRIRSGRGTRGNTGVGALVQQYTGEDISASKKDPAAWRVSFCLLDGLPLRPGLVSAPRSVAMAGAPPTSSMFRVAGEGESARLEPIPGRRVDRYPAEAIDYSLGDAEHQELIAERQVGWWMDLVDRDRARANGNFRVRGEELGVLDERPQAAYAATLADMETVGVYTDGDLARRIRAELLRLVDELRPRLAVAGFLTPRTNRVATERMLARERRGQTRITPGDPFAGYSGEWKSEDNRIREVVASVLGDECPRTDPSASHPQGLPKKDRLTIEIAADELEEQLAELPPGAGGYQRRLLSGMKALAGYNGARYQVEHYLEPMIRAADEGRPMQFRINNLVNSGRTSSASKWITIESDEGIMVGSRDGTNMQNVTRKTSVATLGERCGVPDPWAWADENNVRRVVVPPGPDWVIVDLDYAGIENVTFAETLDCFMNRGKRRADWRPCSLTRLLNSGVDLHSNLAARHYGFADWLDFHARAKGIGRKKEGEAKQQRDSAKPVNFGRPGGMAPPKFQRWLRSQYGWRWSVEEIEAWFATHLSMVPEMPAWKRVLRWQHAHGLPAVQLYSRRVRGGCTINSRGNTYFQGAAIDGAKRGLFMQTCAVHLGRYPVLTLPDRRAPSLDEIRAKMLVSDATHSARFDVDAETCVVTPCEFRWRLPTRVTRRWGKTTYWVEDDRLLGARPFLFVHDAFMNYVPAPREEWTTREETRGGKTRTIDVPPARTLAAMAAMDEIMVRGMQPVVRGKLVQTDGSIMRERWE